MTQHFDTVIVGAGLAGLHLASLLCDAGQSVLLLEARDRIGGRILSIDGVDLGPAWFWPGQPRIAARIAHHGLSVFDQYASGTLSFEQADGQVTRNMGFSSMQGSLRLNGGFTKLIEAEAATLPDSMIHLNAPVTAISHSASQVQITYTTAGQSHTVLTDNVALAAPPRIIAETIQFNPPLTAQADHALRNIPTWMAGQAKVTAIYDTAFWRDAGLSGDAMSRRGPLVEMHDASTENGTPYALFGFVGVPPQARTDRNRLKEACLTQLANIFGPAAAKPRAFHIQDWALETHTAAPADQMPPHVHPEYGMPRPLRNLWDGRLVWSSTEVASQFGGYLEGALEAAYSAAQHIRASHHNGHQNRTA